MSEVRSATAHIGGDDYDIFLVTDGTLGLGVVDVVAQVGGWKHVWLDERTYERIEDNPKLDELFGERAKEWEVGKQYLVEDVSMTSFFQDAVRRKEAEPKPKEKADRITALHVKANALLVQAAEHNREPSAVVAESFGIRLAELRAEMAELQAALDAAEDVLGLASTAVLDAFDAV